jgi:hypothetical protein
MIATERLVCRWCPYTAPRTYWVESPVPLVNPYFLLRAHIQEAHPAEFRRIEHYLSEEVIVQEGQ